MKDRIVMSPNNGQLAIAIPLFRCVQDEVLDRVDNFIISFTTKPVAYAIDCGEEVGIQLMNADFVEKNLEFLGEL